MSETIPPPTPTDPPAATSGLEDTFARYQGELLGMLYYLVGNMEDARDALQESFIKCWRHRDTIHEVQNLKAWVFRIALNTGRDVRQTAWRRRRQSLLPEQVTELSTSGDHAHDRLEQEEDLERLRAALEQLPLEQREIFLLRQNGEMTYEEIGAATGVPTGTVKTRMRLALEKLRKSLPAD